jgi:hypothetical protein
VPTAIANDATRAPAGTATGHDVATPTAAAPAPPNAIPTIQPPSVSNAASTRNCSSTSRWRAPTATRRPISDVRSFTDISMSAVTPAPPTRSAIAARPVPSPPSAAVVRRCMAKKRAAF